jgi:hypothetical protein
MGKASNVLRMLILKNICVNRGSDRSTALGVPVGRLFHPLNGVIDECP